MATRSSPRLVIAGTGGDSGKTLVSLGLIQAWRDEGHPLSVFKKGPDYIDAAWLAWAGGVQARNLDTFLMEPAAVRDGFAAHAVERGFSVIEGNRGLFDGAGVEGTHSTAALARLLAAPVVLVLDVTKQTRTAAAVVLGCRRLDPELDLAGVILNRVAGPRHEHVAREAIERYAGIPVLGALRKQRGGDPLPGRHLGLVTVEEHGGLEDVRARLRAVREDLDLAALAAVARGAPPLAPAPAPAAGPGREPVTIGVLRDSAFTFYYPENLEALEAEGARLVPVSALEDAALPEIDALFIGGGFPETHGAALARNRVLLSSVRRAAQAGLPIYAECGGLMFLAEAIEFRDRTHPMAGVLPVRLAVEDRPQGHGYVEATVDRPNPIFAVGTALRGHEFHYSRVVAGAERVETTLALRRGTGSVPGRDGIVTDNVFASYVHLHARGTPEWAPGLVGRARVHRRERRAGGEESSPGTGR